MNISKATASQLEKVSKLEAKCFPEEPYPRFFFTQARELYSETLLVATDDKNHLIGYILAAPDSSSTGCWWILSMAVDPDSRRKGVGLSLLREMFITLERLKANTVYLSVSEENKSAQKLYESQDFIITRKQEDYFGKNEDRLILKRILTLDSPSSLNQDQLLNEASISVSFSSILFTVSAAILALITPRNDVNEFVVPLILVSLAMFASFYSVLFYANASGALTRIHDYRKITKPLQYGNSVSEYLGIYPLVCAFPILIYFVTDELKITIPVAIVNYLGFFFYQISGFDILSRIIITKKYHILSTVTLLILMCAVLLTTVFSDDSTKYITLIIYLSLLIYLTILGIRNYEKSTT